MSAALLAPAAARPGWLGALLYALLFSATAGAAAPAPFVSPKQWMSALGEHVLAPRYVHLSRSTHTLAERIEASCKTSAAAAAADEAQATLAAARAAWRQAALELRSVSALPFGPVLERRVLRRIDFWPTRPPQIESSLRERAAGTLADARIGVTAKGFPALEYLLFDTSRARLDTEPAACVYASWLARELVTELDTLQPAWSAWLDSVHAADAAAEAQLLSDGVNILIGSVDNLRQKYLEKPARKPAEPTGFDAWRSGAERAHLSAYFDGVRVGLQGRATAPHPSATPSANAAQGIGLSALLRGRGLLELAAQLDAHVDAVARALQALPSPPAADGGAAIAHASAALSALQGLLSREVANRLKIAVGFGDHDGD